MQFKNIITHHQLRNFYFFRTHQTFGNNNYDNIVIIFIYLFYFGPASVTLQHAHY